MYIDIYTLFEEAFFAGVDKYFAVLRTSTSQAEPKACSISNQRLSTCTKREKTVSVCCVP